LVIIITRNYKIIILTFLANPMFEEPIVAFKRNQGDFISNCDLIQNTDLSLIPKRKLYFQ
jgi:hypothetical protein